MDLKIAWGQSSVGS